MNNRVLKYVALLLALMIAVGVGAAIGGGIVYAATKVASKAPAVAAATQVDPEAGIVIASVDPEGPAAAAGVVRGDILLAVDGEAVNHLHDVLALLEAREPGDTVELTVLHGDEERRLTATLGERDGQPYLGLVPCGGLPTERHIELRIMEPGATVVEVMPDSPAEEAGLRVGDRITAVGGQAVDAEHDLAALIQAHQPGDTVTLEVTHPGEEPRQVTVVLGEHPDEEGKAFLGIRYTPFPHIEMIEPDQFPFRVPRFYREPFPIQPGIVMTQGAVIWHVFADSPAEAAGLHKGDVITAVNGEPVESRQALTDAIAQHEPGDTITLTVVRYGETEERQLQVTLGEHPEKEGAAYLGVMLGGFFMEPFEDDEPAPEFKQPERFRFKIPDDLRQRFEFFLPPGDLDIEKLTPPGESM